MNHQIIQPLFVIIINFFLLLLLLLVFLSKCELNDKSNEKRVDHEKKRR
jgi:hypothetical protein